MTERLHVETRTSDAENSGLRLRLARAFTELLAPSIVGVICPVAIGALSDANAWRGAGLPRVEQAVAAGLEPRPDQAGLRPGTAHAAPDTFPEAALH